MVLRSWWCSKIFLLLAVPAAAVAHTVASLYISNISFAFARLLLDGLRAAPGTVWKKETQQKTNVLKNGAKISFYTTKERQKKREPITGKLWTFNPVVIVLLLRSIRMGARKQWRKRRISAWEYFPPVYLLWTAIFAQTHPDDLLLGRDTES